MAQCPIIAMAGTSPAMTKWVMLRVLPCYQSEATDLAHGQTQKIRVRDFFAKLTD
jgi:hypothetical protein